MKYIYKTLLLITAIILHSCSSENMQQEGYQSQETGITCTVEPMVYDEGETTRSSLSLGPSGMLFSWEVGDRLTVFAEGSDDSQNIYTLSYKHSDKSANFQSTKFQLVKDDRYYAISTTERSEPSLVSLPDKRNITLSYKGQRQKANKNTEHLGAFDYLAATNIADDVNHIGLHFLHLGPTLRVIFTNLPEGKKFKKMEMYDSENTFRNPIQTINLSNGVGADGEYAPYFNPQDITSSEYLNSERFSIMLGEQNAGEEQGIAPEGTDIRLEVFIKIPPVDLTGKKIVFFLTPVNSTDNPYYISVDGKNLVGGTAYQMKAKAVKAENYKVKLQINHKWQNGAVTDATRATGDPGKDDDIALPKYIYYVFCVDGKVQEVAPLNGEGEKAVNSISVSGNGNDKWVTSDDKTISTYGQEFTFTVSEVNKSKGKHVYFVASTEDLSESFPSSIKEGDLEANVIRTLKYDIKNTATTNAALDDSQVFLRDLYSTPWSATNFVGDLNDYYKTITLYHTAAKVDLTWNSESVLTGSISANNVKKTDLFLFKPTENTSASGSYTVSAPITTGTMYNGRQVFYLPQFNTYNVTIGTNTQDVQFSPSTANGFTSWLRWLKTY